MNTCTTEGCETPTETYLCADCVRDLQAWLDKGRELLPDLDVTIARLDNVRPTNNEGNNGTKSAGSSAPLNVDAMQLKINLSSMARDAATYATDPHAAGIAALIQTWVTNAELAISGPETEHIDHAANRAKVKDIAPPMPMRELLPWLRTNAKMAITSAAIRQWVNRGFLIPVTRGNMASPGIPAVESTYNPHEVIAAWHERNNR